MDAEPVDTEGWLCVAFCLLLSHKINRENCILSFLKNELFYFVVLQNQA
jgi:hypothetical protein